MNTEAYNVKALAEKQFVSRVARQTAYGVVADYGEVQNKMTLLWVKSLGHYVIEWEVGEEDDFEEIGIWTQGKKVIEYDGVFELPKEAIELLRQAGFVYAEVVA